MLFWKKALSVTLCLAVLLSVMVVGAGAAFSDQNQITHKDAVNRCVSLNIIGGYPDGSYQPKSNITRAEACKILCVTLTGGSEGSLSVPAYPTFTDVRTDRNSSWAEKYITACAAQGIVSGTGGGKFEPSASVTATQLAKMLLTAMGYDAAKYGFTGAAWAANVNRYGELEGLFTNLAGLNKDAALSRDDAAQMLVNAMDADADLYGRGVDTSASETLYKTVLAKCYTALANGWDQETLEKNSFSYLYSYHKNTADIGYAFIDIDGNGIQELLIGQVNAEGNYRGMIYDLYTISNGKVVHILSSGERNRYYLCNNGVIANEASAGADYSTQSFYTLKQGTTLSLIECVIADGTETPSSPWYYSTTVGADRYTYLNKVSISETKAISIIQSYSRQSISYIPFSQ